MNTGSWQPDPTQRHQYRFWDGAKWSDQVSDNGVVGSDPIAAPPAPHPAWTPPTVGAPVVPPTRTKPRGVMIGIAAVAALGIGTVIYLQQDDSSSTSATTSSSVPATSTTAITTTTTSPTPTTVASVIDANTLVAAMPVAGEFPAEWIQYQQPNPEADTTGMGTCNGPTDHGRAAQAGDVTMADGPLWGLPNGGGFGIAPYYFISDSAAEAFLAETVAQANGCTTTGVTWEQTEGDWGIAGGSMPEDTIWQMTTRSAAGEARTSDADQEVRLATERHGSTTHDGTLFTATQGGLGRYERHGQVVILFYIAGIWGEDGWVTFDDAYEPTVSDLDAAVDMVKEGILAKLAAAGAL